KDLPFADELLVEIRFKQLNFLAQRARNLGLLDALGIRQLLLTELQHLPVVEPNGQEADQQQCPQHHPEDARAIEKGRIEPLEAHDGSNASILREARARA